MPDHYTINVAKRIRHDTEPFGPYHTHYLTVQIHFSTPKAAAREIYADVCQRFPEPEFRCELYEQVERTKMVVSSGGTPG